MANDIYFNRNIDPEAERENERPTAGAVNKYVERIGDSQPRQQDYTGAANQQTPVRQTRQQNYGGTVNQQASARQVRRTSSQAPVKKTDTTQKNGGKKKKKKNRHIAAKILCVILVLVLLFCSVLGVAAAVVLKDYTSEDYEYNVDEDFAGDALSSSAGVYNLLLMGVDNMKTESSSRSDSMMILSINPAKHSLKLTSVMRDSFVEIKGDEWAKLNAACSKGGPQLVADTIEYNFGVRIDGYVKIGYEMLINLVDGIGGITIPEITEREALYMGYEGVTVTAGENVHLDGAQTLQYCRIRHDAATADFRRTERQRETLSIIIKKMAKTNPFTLINLFSDIAGEMECSVSKSEMVKLAFRVLPCLAGDIETGRVPVDDGWTSASDSKYGSILKLDRNMNKDYLKEFIYG